MGEGPGGKLMPEDIEDLKYRDRLKQLRNDRSATPAVQEKIDNTQDKLQEGPLEKVTPPPKVTGTGGSGAGPGR
ncbi:hypothetical protein MUP56_00185 [Patescibacteria group bacterium]|nr:hypothetical protein [Patescibacteria group bacterium]